MPEKNAKAAKQLGKKLVVNAHVVSFSIIGNFELNTYLLFCGIASKCFFCFCSKG
ncbi:MAG: hypothetical protein VB108_03525 [Anaerolineaceae bacterium]|nr:hypothetical protein [Anaerolineaceae bacterium]